MAETTPAQALKRTLGFTHAPTGITGSAAEETYTLVKELYGNAEHRSGVKLIDHALGVLAILLPFEPDEETVQTCLLQHVLEQKELTLAELEEKFGSSVRGLVSSIHLLSHVTMQGRRTSIEELRLMLVGMSDDVRVFPIILAERTFILAECPGIPLPERKRICRDVLGLFAPVAARLGMHAFKQRLEALAFPVLYPSDAEMIADQMKATVKRTGPFLTSAARGLEQALRAEGMAASVEGREKQPYSVFMKMSKKGYSSIEQMPDLFALRVIVSTADECYQTLGILHRLGRPVANRFKDYIAFPKPNGYQSLHTTMARFQGVPEGVFVEVQVRTADMHRQAEYGIAAHWSYKEGSGAAERAVQRIHIQHALTSQEALEGAKRERSVLVDHIYVLTPKGDVVELPEGATALDFAFQIHTTLGLSFRAARVNGKVVPIDDELENGDVVEILTHKTPRPSPDWLQMLTMASSRSRLKHYLYDQQRSEYVTKGREIFNAELARHKMLPLDDDLSLLRNFDDRVLTQEQREDLLFKLGQGSEKPGPMLRKIEGVRIPQTRLAPMNTRPRLQRKDAIIEIEGGVPMPIRFAKCCKVQEKKGDPVIGIVTRGGDVVVHTQKCRQIKRVNPERKIGVRWK